MCLVFHKGAASRTQFAVAHCTTPDCDGRIEVDGYEYGILRQSPQYAFCHTLLYSWRHQLVPVPSTWYTFWRRTLQDYKDASQQVCSFVAKLWATCVLLPWPSLDESAVLRTFSMLACMPWSLRRAQLHQKHPTSA
jgi:hypothetical protein